MANEFFLRVDYDEFNPDSYRAVVLHNGSEEQSFSTGQFFVDYAAALAAAGTRTVAASSSLHNFITDLEQKILRDSTSNKCVFS